MSWRLDKGSGALAMAGWLVAAIVFSYRYADPKWLDPISTVKSRQGFFFCGGGSLAFARCTEKSAERSL